MSTFASLLKYRTGKDPGGAQQKARSGFAKAVSRSGFSLRDPSAPVPSVGRCVILGVATYSPDELKLLDELEDSRSHGGAEDVDVEVFDVLDCTRPEDFQKFIPGIDGVFRTPVVGVLVDGRLVDSATGLADVEATLRRFKVLNQR